MFIEHLLNEYFIELSYISTKLLINLLHYKIINHYKYMAIVDSTLLSD